ncbi:MAG: LysR substrate-binding domain-containing protein [Chloroflexota bacterium]|nr:LysR substrate-binding domain-containing protein [Chloroflexota bacterium]
MTDLTKLKSFLYAAEHLNFTKAAQQLHVTQPTISHHIKSIEDEMDVILFDRSDYNIRITDAGRLLLPWARKLIRQSIEMQEMMKSLQDNIVGGLRIACSTTAGKYVLPQLAARFSQSHPGVRVNILRCNPDTVIPNLLDNEANLGVVSYEALEKNMELQEFFNDYISLIVPSDHPFAMRHQISPEELIDEPIIMREPTSGTRRVVLAELAKHDISIEDMNIFMTIGNAEAIVQTVAAGYGISFASTLAIDCPLQSGSVASIDVQGVNLQRKIYMLRKRLDDPYRPQEAFWSFVHDPSNLDLLQLSKACDL